jgi:hypothetical protein
LRSGKQERRGGIETRFTQGGTVGVRPKQERRGGIETSLSRDRSAGSPAKQERRGGIETEGKEGLGGLLVEGSRNAVVALKPMIAAGSSSSVIAKQERQTGPSAIQRLPPGWKQERRGGIETPQAGYTRSFERSEAGTPWWH